MTTTIPRTTYWPTTNQPATDLVRGGASTVGESPGCQCAEGPPCLRYSILCDQKQHGAHLLVTSTRGECQVDVQREGFIECLVQHIDRDTRQRTLALGQFTATP